MANVYDLGDLVRLTGQFTISGISTDPTTVTVMVKDPRGAVTSYTAVKDSIGNYHYDLTVNTVGEWRYRFIGAGAGAVGAGENSLLVNKSNVVF